MGILSRLFGVPDKKMLIEEINNGALLLDVRTREEFSEGHVKKSINIPVSQMPKEFVTLSKEKSIVAVCESGARSAQIVRFLNKKGYKSYNGGSWKTFRNLDAD